MKLEANISPARGAVVAQQFGDDDQYDNVIAIEDQDIPIDEHTVIWIGANPQTEPWTHIVRKVARSLPTFGCTLVAVSKVTVS